MTPRATVPLLLLSLGGCASGSAPASAPAKAVDCPEGQSFDGSYCQVTGPPPPEQAGPAPSASTSATQPAEVPPTEPTGAGEPSAVPPGTAAAAAEPTTPAAPAVRATPVDVTMAAQAGPLVQYLAAAHLPPGAAPFGAPFAAQFAEGQVFEQTVQLAAGRCYTVVASGLPPIAELDLALRALDAPAGGAALATDTTTGPQAVLGARDACVRSDGTAVTLVLKVTRGQGVAAGQVFQK